MKPDTTTNTREYPRAKDDNEALQVAIDKWVRFQYRIWQETLEQPLGRYNLWSIVFRVMIIVLAGSITVMSDMDTVPRIGITIVAGVLTILTGVEGYLKLADRKVAGENRKRELLAEQDKWSYDWMVKVELEIDTAKALTESKKLLVDAPKAINDLLGKYVSSKAEAPAVTKL